MTAFRTMLSASPRPLSAAAAEEARLRRTLLANKAIIKLRAALAPGAG
jgi:hypothetical protein